MRSFARLLPLLQTLALGLCCCHGGPPPTTSPGAQPDALALPSLESSSSVVIFSAAIRSEPGSGLRLGEIAPGVVVKVGRSHEGWSQIEAEGPPRVAGWVQHERLGCRALEELPLLPLDQRKPEVTIRPGALLALRASVEELIEVETQGSISVRGRIKRSACGVGAPFIPTLPRDGVPHILTREATLTTEPNGGKSVQLAPGERFAVFIEQGRLVYGRTDGPVVVRGYVDAGSVTRDKTTPFDRLAEPLGYTHEVIVDAPLQESQQGRPLTTLPGGTPLNVGERHGGWSQVTTFGAIRLEGWIEDQQLRRVSLDYNELDPAARRRQHSPPERDIPRGLEPLSEQ